MQIIYVLVELTARALDRPFSYLDEKDEVKCLGVRVKITFNNRHLVGYVVDVKKDDRTKEEILSSSPFLMTNIDEVIDDTPLLDEDLLALANMMKDYYLSPLISIYQAMLPPSLKPTRSSFNAPKIRYDSYVRISKDSDETFLSVKQLEMYRFIKNEKEVAKKDLKNHITVVNNLIKLGKLELFKREVYRTSGDDTLFEERKKVVLNDEQKNVCEDFLRSEDDVYLLHGVTGSGKTEVYMQLIEKQLAVKKTALMLVPEISLTPQVLANFKARFGNQVAIIHSGLSAGERFDEWKRIFFGEAKVVVGARSAIFCPLENLGVIIIDEEHEQSYVSESNPRYDTHMVAEFRQKYNNCALVLGSATPSIESYAKALDGDYQLVEMPLRVNGNEMPKILIVDMLLELRQGNNQIFSIPLLYELRDVVKNKKQAMIFINRRGFSSFQRCRQCGYVAKCTDCDVSLVYHHYENKLKCHYCGKRFRALDICPSCGSKDIKQGAIGTERVVEELKKLFPEATVLRMDNDTTSKKNSHRQILNDLDINSLANENIICCPECGQQIKLPDEIVKKIRQSKFIGQNLDITC